MRKEEFLAQLRKGLSGLPQEDIEERIAFYNEMIEDRTEDGLTEEEAVGAVGSVDEIVKQIVAEIPLSKIARARMKPERRLKAWEIVLLVLGSPLWLSLVVAAIAVILSIYVSIWSVIVSLWAVFASVIACAVAGAAAGIVLACSGNAFSGIAMLGGGLICAGLSIFMYYGCKAASAGTFVLTRNIALWIKSCFIKKEEAQ